MADEGLELAWQQGGLRLPSVLSGVRLLSSSPHCPCDLVAKASEFSSEGRNHMRGTLSSCVQQNMEEPK